MSIYWRCWYWKLGLAISLAIAGAITDPGDCARAQITPDGTLGAESSVVTPQAPGSTVDVIQGGATRGANLFHSFKQFSVPTGGAAYFNNALDIQNIISRVTGKSISNIDGLIRANGTANLFLLNPNGIVFGPNASLNIGGSFAASTANAIQFGDQGFFSASALNIPPVLTVNPSAFLFNQIKAAPIENRSRSDAGSDPAGESGYFGLRVPDGRSLLLVGGDLKANGGGIVAFGGQVGLAAVAGAGTVELKVSDNNLSLSVPDSILKADVLLTNEAGFIVTAGGGGNIAITAKNINMNNSSLTAGILNNLGSDDAQAGDITLNATGSVSLTNVAQLINFTSGQGNAGNITIIARDTVSFDGRDETDQFPSAAFTSVESGAVGNGGNINIKTGSLSITNRAQLSSNTEGAGNAGNISVEARDQVSLSNSIMISEVSEEGGVGNGGDINIKARSLLLKDGSSLLADMENRGNAGNITIEALDAVILEGTGPGAQTGSALDGFIVPSQITATVEPEDSNVVGEGGKISISTSSLLIDEGFISANTEAQGNAGSINITTRNLSGTDGGQIRASTFGKGNAGSVIISASEKVSFDGEDSQGFVSGAFSNVGENAEGNGGGINITAGSISVTNGAELTTSSEGSGAAGNIEVAADSIRLDNLASLRADTTAEQGNIILHSQDLVLRRGSNITTNATGTATGGNITIDTVVIAAFEDSDISANAQNARGGRVIIDAQGIFGTEFREDETPQSDITATSELGLEFSGTVEINTPDVDPSQGLVNLPVELVDASGLIASSCEAGGENEFIVTGRGGLPPNPSDPLSSDTVWSDLRTFTQQAETRPSSTFATQPTNSTAGQLVEAQGWVINNKGEVVLTATAPTVTLHIPWLPPASCQGS